MSETSTPAGGSSDATVSPGGGRVWWRRNDAAPWRARPDQRDRDLGRGDVARREHLLQHHPAGGAGRRGDPAVLPRRLPRGAAGGQPVQRVLARAALQRLGLHLRTRGAGRALRLPHRLDRPHRHRARRPVLIRPHEREPADARLSLLRREHRLADLLRRGGGRRLRHQLHRHPRVAACGPDAAGLRDRRLPDARGARSLQRRLEWRAEPRAVQSGVGPGRAAT